MNMPCPRCGAASRVVDSRFRKKGTSVRRRRECLSLKCGKRFSTLELGTGVVKKLLKNHN